MSIMKSLVGLPGYCEATFGSTTYRPTIDGGKKFIQDARTLGFEVRGEPGYAQALDDGKITGEWTDRDGGQLSFDL